MGTEAPRDAAVRFDVVVIGGGDLALIEAIAAAGGRIATRLGWTDPLPDGADALLLLDATDVDETRLAAALPDLAGHVDVAVVPREHLDLVADALLFTDAALLCEAGMAELAFEIALAAQAPEPVFGSTGVRENDGARLARFSGEVARIAGALARLAASEGVGDVADRRPAYDAGPVDIAVDPQAIRAALRARRLRDGFFGDGLFEEPAWDMLLDLFAAELEGTRVSVSSLCIAAAVAPTTALRWIGRLTAEGWFERRPDPRDKRRAFVALSPRGAAAMRGYLVAVSRAGLAIG